MRFAMRLLLSKLRRKRYSWKALFGQSTAELCESLGTTFIKIGQILSTRYDLFPPDVTTPLTRLQDRLKPFAFRHVPAIIQTQSGCSLSEIFAQFEVQPISSASIASVYRARLHSGQQVAVKIRRPDIVSKVYNDLRIMRLFARILACLPAMQLIPVVDMIDELGQCIEQQLDLRIEAQNTLHFRECFAQEPQVQIPALIEEYCTEAMLVMEFIDGLVRIDELDWEEADYQKSLITGLRALYHMIFADGFIHCDLHPGNFYLLKGGHIVILDTGFIAKMDQNDRYQFAEFFLSIGTNAGKSCARIIYETASRKTTTFDQEGFERAVVELIDRNAGSKAGVFQVAPFVIKIFDIQRQFGLRSSTSFIMAILSLLVFEGIAKQLYPQLDFQAEARPILLQVLLQRNSELSS
jgi:ubiquinone biosynthesis protein